MRELAAWATTSGLPSRHIAHAAMHVAAVIDAGGSRALDAQESYWHRATGGRYPPADLVLGQALLVDLGLLIEDGAMLRPTIELGELLAGTVDDALAALAARVAADSPHICADLDAAGLSDLVPDPDRRDELLLQLARRFDDERNRLVGDAGERLVVAEAHAELVGLDRPDLAREIRRVSVTSDQLGYDVRAPRLQGQPRRLEVKATTVPDDSEHVTLFITRNEADAGRRVDGWSLVLCHVADPIAATGAIVGWWSYEDLADRLPRDVEGGSWSQAELTLPLSQARPGLPSAVH